MHPVEVILIPLGKVFRNRRADASASLANSPELATESRFAVTSPSFDEGQEIPAKYCGALIGDNISPALAWGALPAGTVALVLVMEDLDSPGKAPRLHVIAEFAATANVNEGALNSGAAGVRFLRGRRGTGRYQGPRPLPGHGPHHYRFHVYAVDQRIDVSAILEPQLLSAAMAGHVLASGMITGTRTS